MQKILIIEDDKGIAESLKLYLKNSNFEVFLCFDGNLAFDCIEKYNPDLLILDINLPGKSGIEICKEIRINSSLSIIMLTARSSEMDRIIGLELGADDYIAKPFSPRELLARINTILRRVEKNKLKEIDSNFIVFDNIKLETGKKLAYIDNVQIILTGIEFDLLKKIIEADGKLVTRIKLMNEVMGYDNYLYDRTIDTHIKNLRKKLGKKEIILTIRGEGYRLNK